MIRAYCQSAATLNLLRAFATGGYAAMQRVTQWNLDFTEKSEQVDRYRELAHVEFLRGVANPLGIKVSDKMDPKELVTPCFVSPPTTSPVFPPTRPNSMSHSSGNDGVVPVKMKSSQMKKKLKMKQREEERKPSVAISSLLCHGYGSCQPHMGNQR